MFIDFLEMLPSGRELQFTSKNNGNVAITLLFVLIMGIEVDAVQGNLEMVC